MRGRRLLYVNRKGESAQFKLPPLSASLDHFDPDSNLTHKQNHTQGMCKYFLEYEQHIFTV